MPVAARADRENRGGAEGCKTSRRVVGTASQTEDEDPSSPLGHSEVASVENPVRHAIPELCHATCERRHVSPSMTGEESRYVLEEDGGRSVSFHKVEEREGEAAPFPGEACSLPGDGEVLTRESARPEGCVSVGVRCPSPADAFASVTEEAFDERRDRLETSFTSVFVDGAAASNTSPP